MKDAIIVIGNDDDASEVTLVPLSLNESQWTPREKGARGVVAQLLKDLVEHWGDLGTRTSLHGFSTQYIGDDGAKGANYIFPTIPKASR